MDNYVLSEDIDEETPLPFPDELKINILQFEIKKNTKFSGIIARIEKEFQVFIFYILFKY